MEQFDGEEVPEGRDEFLPDRPLRFLPKGGGLVEVTTRTIHGRFLLKPSPRCVEIIEGVLGRALAVNPEIRLVGYWFLSNHYGLLAVTPDAPTLSAFMDHVNGNLAKELGRLYGWRERFWGRRYRPIYVGDSPWIQVNRLRYLLSQGTKEGLVAAPAQWPGASCLRALTELKDAVGVWFDRTKEYRARLRGKVLSSRYEFATEYPIVLAPLPCWERFSPEERAARCRELVTEIEAENLAFNRKTGRKPLGVKAILAQDPHDKPTNSARSPAPLSHGNRGERHWFKNLYWDFVRRYRAASQRLRDGVIEAISEFPPCCFLPRLPLGIRLERAPPDTPGLQPTI